MTPQIPNLGALILLELIFAVVIFALGIFITYMFYARLRDIGNELRRIRTIYEMEQERAVRGAARLPATTPGRKDPSAGDERYMPKS